MHWQFKEQHPLEERKIEAVSMISRYPDRIPVVVQCAPHGQINDIDKHKFLVPFELTIAQFIWYIRKRAKISANKSIFLFIRGKELPQAGSLMGEIYRDCKDEDGFLYIQYSGENTFGTE